MADFSREIDAALGGTNPIPRSSVLHWIENATNLRTLAKFYRLTDEPYYRIETELGMAEGGRRNTGGAGGGKASGLAT